MPSSNNPFRPNHPVYQGVFAGRSAEIHRICSVLKETRNGNPTNLLFVGERGIGKTSLILLAKALAKAKWEELNLSSEYLVLSVRIDKKTSSSELCRKIAKELERGIGESAKALEFMKKAWSFIQRIEAAGIKINPGPVMTDSELFDELTYSLTDTLKAIAGPGNAWGMSKQNDGIVLLIDEADNASRELDLGSLLKNLTERLVEEDCQNFFIIMAGLPDVVEVLNASHPSSLRLFEQIPLNPLKENEVKSVVIDGLAIANKKNERPVTITDDALDTIAFWSEGYPHFVQQFAYSAYAADTDYEIDEEDVTNSAFGEGGALDAIGHRYYKDMYFKQIREESYREVLKIMATKWDDWVSKDEIRRKFSGKATTLNNALKALTDRHIILKKQGVRGFYRLQWLGFALWIRNYTNRDPRKYLHS